MIQTLSTVMQLFKGSYFSVGATSKHFWPNSAIAIARYLTNVMYELCFSCFKVEYKRSYNFHSFSNKTIIVIQLDMDFNSGVSNLPGQKKKNELSEQHDTCFLLKSHYNVFYLVKMRNLSRNNSVRE